MLRPTLLLLSVLALTACGSRAHQAEAPTSAVPTITSAPSAEATAGSSAAPPPGDVSPSRRPTGAASIGASAAPTSGVQPPEQVFTSGDDPEAVQALLATAHARGYVVDDSRQFVAAIDGDCSDVRNKATTWSAILDRDLSTHGGSRDDVRRFVDYEEHTYCPTRTYG